eukprot:SAG31_NODE_25270_length_464_cov_1.978082_1_plen_41_part_01
MDLPRSKPTLPSDLFQAPWCHVSSIDTMRAEPSGRLWMDEQ